MIIWITGLSSSGKTTLSNKLYNELNEIPKLIQVDGDVVREIFDETSDYSISGRIRQINRIQKISKFLEKNHFTVIVSALYSNHELLKWNRENFKNYYEIFIDVPITILKKRDKKGVYSNNKNVVGLDIDWEKPIASADSILKYENKLPNYLIACIGGGSNARITRNLYYDVLHTLIPSLTYKDCTLLSSVRRTGTNSPESTSLDTTFTMRSTNDFITLNDNNFFERPSIIASSINEQSHVTGGPTSKSFECRLQFSSSNQNLSPVIDIGTIGALGIMNRINDIDSSSDLPTQMVHIPSNLP